MRRNYDAGLRFTFASHITVKSLVSYTFQPSAPHTQLPRAPLPEYWFNPPASGLKLRTPHHGPILVGIKYEPSVNVSLRGHSYRRSQGNSRELHMLGARWVVTVTLMDAKSVVSLPSRTRLKRETAVGAPCGGSCDPVGEHRTVDSWARRTTTLELYRIRGWGVRAVNRDILNVAL